MMRGQWKTTTALFTPPPNYSSSIQTFSVIEDHLCDGHSGFEAQLSTGNAVSSGHGSSGSRNEASSGLLLSELLIERHWVFPNRVVHHASAFEKDIQSANDGYDGCPHSSISRYSALISRHNPSNRQEEHHSGDVRCNDMQLRQH